MNVLVFDIETVPDITGGKIIHDLQGLDDESTAKALFHFENKKLAVIFYLYIYKR